MGEVLPRRFYSILSRAMYAFVAWILALIFAIEFEYEEKSFKRHPDHSVTFFLMTLPLYMIVLFGCYSMIAIGYHMIILCKYKNHFGAITTLFSHYNN